MGTGLGELLPVVNRQDKELGLEHRRRIHQLGLMHRTTHVLVFNRKGQVYLQRRSPEKDTYPGRWTSSASGHVEAGESYLVAAYRELREELNLVETCKALGLLKPQPATDQAFVAVYAAFTRAALQPNYLEIVEGRFFSQREAWQIARNKGLATPPLKLVLALAGRRGCFQHLP